jgi:hypothetical protein
MSFLPGVVVSVVIELKENMILVAMKFDQGTRAQILRKVTIPDINTVIDAAEKKIDI